MSSDAGEVSDEDAKPQLSPSAYLQAPSSSQSIGAESQIRHDETHAIHSNDENASDEDLYSEEERENRFTGPSSTWRGYTADERALAASLDQERANDLSVHLYNAHALKARLYDPEVAAEAKPWQSKDRWMARDAEGKLPWHPDQHWTAWPLPVEDIPRQGEAFGQDTARQHADESTFRKVEAWRPAADLQEELEAIMLRQAKQRFRLRPSDSVEQPSGSRSQISSRSRSRRASAASSRRTSVASSASSGEVEAIADGIHAHETAAPTMMTDSEKARRLLAPLSQHTLSKLDGLLVALHKSRQVHVASSQHAEDASAGRKPRKRKRSATADEGVVPAKKTKKRVYSEHPSGDHALRPRDWSEILGFAALTGWNPSVLDRAAKRCSALFGETMSFRIMPESANGGAAERFVDYNPTQIPHLELCEDNGVEDESFGVHELACPEESCARYHRPFEQRWRLREHLKKAHGYTKDDLDDHDQLAKSPRDEDSVVDSTGPDDQASANTGGARDDATKVHLDGFLQPIEVSFKRGKDIAIRRSRSKMKDAEPHDVEGGAGADAEQP